MDGNKIYTRNSKDQSSDNKFVPRVIVKPESAVNGNDSADSILEPGGSENEVKSMRLILPAFIENEQRYAQVEHKRKIQSSPAKSMRRFSQDSTYLDRQMNVS